MKNCWLIWIGLSFILTSCYTTRECQVNSGHPPLTKNNLKAINGNYDNGLWGCFKIFHGKIKPLPNDYVRLTAINKHTIDAKLMRVDSVLSQKNLHGHINRRGYFSLRRQGYVIPAVPIFFLYHIQKCDLILTEGNDLNVAYATGGVLIILGASGGDKMQENIIYKRLQ
jgi:hypothetical protein